MVAFRRKLDEGKALEKELRGTTYAEVGPWSEERGVPLVEAPRPPRGARGVFLPDGSWHPIPYVDSNKAELVLRHKVLRLSSKPRAITQERIADLGGVAAGAAPPSRRC